MKRKTAFLMAAMMAVTSMFADGLTVFALEPETVAETTETTEPMMPEADSNAAEETVMSDTTEEMPEITIPEATEPTENEIPEAETVEDASTLPESEDAAAEDEAGTVASDVAETDGTVGETTDEITDQIAETTGMQSDIDGAQNIDHADEISLIEEIEIVDDGTVTAQDATDVAETIRLNETVRVTITTDITEDKPLNFVFRNEGRSGSCRYIVKVSNVNKNTGAELIMQGSFGANNGSVSFLLYDRPYSEVSSSEVMMSDFSIIKLWPDKYTRWEEGTQSTFDLTIVEAPNNSNAKNIEPGFSEAFSLGLEEHFKAYQYTPAVSGRYTLYIDNCNDIFPIETNLFDELPPDNWPENLCRVPLCGSLTYRLEAGKTYYYVVMRNSLDPVSGVVHFAKTPDIIGAKLISNPTKREYVKGTDTSVDWSGMKVQVNYSDGSYSTLTPAANEYAYNIQYTDKYGNPFYCKTYNANMEGDRNSTYNSDYFQIGENTPAGTYYMCADVYERTGDDDTFVTRVPVLFAIADSGQQAHIWGEWETKTPATAVEEGEMIRTCTLCGATDTMPIDKLRATLTLNVTSIKLKTKQSTTKVKVSGLAAGDAVASWTSSNPKIVTVNANGKISAKSKKGKATITVTLKSGLTGEIKVTVQKKAVACTKVTLNKKSVTLKKGKKFTLKPTVAPITCIQKVKYKSSNPSVATVSGKGVIKAKKKGKATITVTVGKKKAKCKVKVK